MEKKIASSSLIPTRSPTRSTLWEWSPGMRVFLPSPHITSMLLNSSTLT